MAVAVSGGADSVALFHLLEALSGDLGIVLLVVHFNHTLRGAESDEDERFVCELARAANREFLVARADVAAEARRHHWNLEDAARRLRYQFFTSVVEAGRADRVAVAHTADDQAETVLAHMLRGTGPSGLAGIYPIAGCAVRPLLHVRRAELRKFLEQRGVNWCEDSSNRDTHRLRARLRHQLLPELERDFSSTIVERLGALAQLAGDEARFWDALVEDRFGAFVTESADGFSIRAADLLAPLSFSALAASDGGPASEVYRSVAQRLTRRILEAVRSGHQGITAQHVEQTLRLASELPSGRRIELPGAMVERNFDRLLFSRAKTAGENPRTDGTAMSRTAYEYAVELPEKGSTAIAVPELGRRFRLKLIDWPMRARDTKKTRVEALDADRLRSPLVLRNWRPGDAYCPRGRAREQKLKRLFLTGRIALRERARWPVLTSAGRLVWVRGMPAAAEFAARGETRTGLVIAEEGL